VDEIENLLGEHATACSCIWRSHSSPGLRLESIEVDLKTATKSNRDSISALFDFGQTATHLIIAPFKNVVILLLLSLIPLNEDTSSFNDTRVWWSAKRGKFDLGQGIYLFYNIEQEDAGCQRANGRIYVSVIEQPPPIQKISRKRSSTLSSLFLKIISFGTILHRSDENWW
jgi:hypothetical protein